MDVETKEKITFIHIRFLMISYIKNIAIFL